MPSDLFLLFIVHRHRMQSLWHRVWIESVEAVVFFALSRLIWDLTVYHILEVEIHRHMLIQYDDDLMNVIFILCGDLYFFCWFCLVEVEKWEKNVEMNINWYWNILSCSCVSFTSFTSINLKTLEHENSNQTGILRLWNIRLSSCSRY